MFCPISDCEELNRRFDEDRQAPVGPLGDDMSDSDSDAGVDEHVRYIGEERDRRTQALYERRLRLVNQNQVQASLHFVRRMDLFMKFLVGHQPLLCGKITDFVIRYETQGRGSVHAHMLWWIDLNEEYIRPRDRVAITQEQLRLLFSAQSETGDQVRPGDPVRSSPTDHSSSTQAATPLSATAPAAAVSASAIYNQNFLDYTNANIWALSAADNVRQRLDIGVRLEQMR